MGFGAGALLSAIAYELIPESALGGWKMGVAFLVGAFTFFGADWWIDHRGGADRKDIAGGQSRLGSAIFIGTLLDNIPESIILGMSLALGGSINVGFPGSCVYLEPAGRCRRYGQSRSCRSFST